MSGPVSEADVAPVEDADAVVDVLEPDGPTRLLLLGGAPFGEILMWWNLVARTRAEMEAASADWQSESDRFGRVASDLAGMDAPRPSWMPTAGR